MSLGLVDFHCHLDLYPDFAAIIAECERLGIYTLAVTTTPKAWPRNHELAEKTQHVYAALGLHPQLVAERGDELSLWEEYLPETRYIGEVGLDASPRFYKSLDQQKRIFEYVLRSCEKAGGKILTVHSVRAATPVLDMIETYLPLARGQVVMHWFTGSQSEARRAVKMGCYFSINHEMLKKERSCELVAALPIDRLLTETDGPFTRFQSCPAQPKNIAHTVTELARIRGVEDSEIVASIRTNLHRLLSINGCHETSSS
ncbi:putative metal-dependent hydrolase YjjV [Methylococcales bacterium]|nr:putative metal-dependent hydrolase YjjV [Methylococcales bacterium]